MSKIYTRNGDFGQTKCLTGKAESKDSTIIMCIGALDELQAWIAHLVTCSASAKLSDRDEELIKIYDDLVQIMAHVSSENRRELTELSDLEKFIDSSKAAEINFFKRPSSQESALFNIVRTVCRRAESLYWKYISEKQLKDKGVGVYLNRLSDYLYTRRAVLL